jgi:hypothetical protein
MADALDGGALDRWRREPTAFITEVLRDPETGRPFDLLQSELRFLAGLREHNSQGRRRLNFCRGWGSSSDPFSSFTKTAFSA